MKQWLFCLALFPAAVLAQTAAPGSATGSGVTNVQAPGNLAATQAPGCIALSAANRKMTPPDLYNGLRECVSQEKYAEAAELFALAGLYGNFDAQRVADKTAGQAKTVLVMNLLGSVSDEQKTKLSAEVSRMAGSPESLARLCGEVRKIGAPDYYPRYMIMHGMRAFTGNADEGALRSDFDAAKVWATLQTSYLHCP